MKIKTEPRQIYEEHQKAVNYKNAISLHENSRVNENFYLGKQWEGLNAPDLPKPTLNFLKRVVSYCIAMIVSDDVAVSFAPFAGDSRQDALAKIIAKEVEKVIEQNDAASIHRSVVRNAAVSGDGIVHLWFEADAETGQAMKGRIRIESLENINFHPGNPYIHSIQQQPFIIISMRNMADEVREEAEENGATKEDIENIVPDSGEEQGETGDNSSLVTVFIKCWKDKKTGTIHAKKTTEKAVVKGEWDTKLTLYPFASMRWEEVRSQFFGNAMLNGLIQNQVSVNRLFAMTIRSVEMMAFPKVVYDSSKITGGWSNRIGEAIGAAGPVDQNVMTTVRGGDVSSQVMQVIESVITMTRDFMGASDAALGNVKPDNTSAIIAVQQAAAMPLALQQREFYRFVEDYARIIVDMMRANYGKREIIVSDKALFGAVPPELMELAPTAEAFPVQVDFSTFENVNKDMRVDVGASAYWSELMQIQTMDGLLRAGIISDMEVYLDSIPDRMLKNKNKLLESIREQKAMAQQQGILQAQLEQGAPPQGGVSNISRQP